MARVDGITARVEYEAQFRSAVEAHAAFTAPIPDDWREANRSAPLEISVSFPALERRVEGRDELVDNVTVPELLEAPERGECPLCGALKLEGGIDKRVRSKNEAVTAGIDEVTPDKGAILEVAPVDDDTHVGERLAFDDLRHVSTPSDDARTGSPDESSVGSL